MSGYLPYNETVLLNAPLDSFYPLTQANETSAQEVAELFYENKLIQQKVNASQMFFRN